MRTTAEREARIVVAKCGELWKTRRHGQTRQGDSDLQGPRKDVKRSGMFKERVRWEVKSKDVIVKGSWVSC